MPPSNKVKLVRTDGTELYVDADKAEKLKVLGYKQAEARDINLQAEEAGREEYYSSTGNQVAAGIEGLARGASLGLSDGVLGDDETAARARYNPGIATATEITGAVLGGMVTGTPANAIGRAAEGVVGAGGGALRGAARGAVEGGLFGGAMAADHAYLDGQPITAEAVLHGMGWNALFGAGLGAVGGGLASRGAKNAAKGAAQEAEGLAVLNKAPEASPGAYKAVAEAPYRSVKAEAARASEEISSAIKTTDAILSNNKAAIRNLGFDRTMAEGAIGRARIEIQAAANKANKALNKKGFTEDGIAKALDDYETVVAKAYNKAGLTNTGSGKQALMEHMQLKLVQKELQKFPHTAEQFAVMNPKRAEDMFAAFEKAKGLSAFPTIGQGLEAQANKLQEALGLTPEGISGLRKAWEQASKQLKAERGVTKSAKAAEAAPEPGLMRKVAGWGAGAVTYKAVAATGHPLLAIGAASKVRNSVLKSGGAKTPELMAARNATLGRIKQAVGKYQAKAGKVTMAVAPKLEPLTRRLDGTIDTSTKDKSQLAYNRIDEFARASTHVKETLYRAVEPIAVEQPELGPALHQAGLSAFAAFRSMIPADPGVVSGLKSIWKPSSLQAAVMSRQMAVFQDPVGVAEEMLFTGTFDPIRVKAMKEIAPQVYEHLRNEMLVRVQEPGFLDGMNYKDQWALGALLDIPIHSSMRPEFIAASQALHMTRNQPLPTPAMPGGSDVGGRPPADTPGATAAQITTHR